MAVVTLHTFGMPHDDDLELDRQIDEEMAKPMACPPMVAGERRCPYFRCRAHMGLDVTRAGTLTHQGETLRLQPRPGEFDVDDFGDMLVKWLMTVPGNRVCAYDIVDQHPDGMTLYKTSLEFGLTRERIRQIEANGLLSLRSRVGDDDQTARAPAPVSAPVSPAGHRVAPLHASASA